MGIFIEETNMKKLLKVLVCFWTFPQEFLGGLLVLYLSGKKTFIKIGNNHYMVYMVPKLFHSAISLGSYVVLDARVSFSENTIKHEFGHSKQSLILGWLYLPVIGIPSLIRNVYSRIFKKNADWYYAHFPENWADKLGGVDR